MICKNCRKEIPDGSTFCSHCGYDLRRNNFSNHSDNSEEQIPLVLLTKQIVKHKVAVIVSIIVVALAIGGYFAFKKHQEKKQAEIALKESIDHILTIVGVYTNNNMALELSANNTARLKINLNSYNTRTYMGYWREKAEGYPIEIDFSDSFETYIGNKKRYACNKLYLYESCLWESLDAIRSDDYSACEYLDKQE